MQNKSGSKLVVVGVDGSPAAGYAVRWALEEAVSRNVALRIVHAVGVEEPGHATSGQIDYAQSSLDAAKAVVDAAGIPVKVNREILWGAVSSVLIDESTRAALLCVGAMGVDGHSGEMIGSTAAALAENARCPVAIIRPSRGGPARGVDWIVVLVNDHPENDAVIESAIQEAQLRRAPVLAVGVWAEDLGEISYDELDRRMATWKLRYPDVPVHLVATAGGIGQFLASHADESVQLAVIGEDDVDQIAYLVWPECHPEAQNGERSVLVVPHSVRVSSAL